MKRSEAIEAISIELEVIRAENYFDEKGSEWCADLILKRISELGMLPPVQDRESDIFVNPCGDEYVYLGDLQWEPEKKKLTSKN